MPDRESRRELLVLDFQGALIPNPHAAEIGSACVELPPGATESLLSPAMSAAARELNLRVADEKKVCGGEAIDLAALFEALRERLRGILTQVLEAFPETTAENLAHQFPLLLPLQKNAVAEWVDATAIFLERLKGDAPRLAAWLGNEKPLGLAALTPASSDSHAGGHRVLRLIFRDGRCIYYKPRAVTGEWLWDRLIEAVNAESSLHLASASVLAGANARYGWVASLLPHPRLQEWDKNSQEARDYWHAAGATLCLAEHVRMTDLHMGNVMATSSGPALFDAESLGTPRFAASAKPWTEAALAGAIGDLDDTLLLPGRDLGGAPDTSGLFGRAAAAPGILVPRWSAADDGGQRLELMPAALADPGNAPPGASPVEALPQLLGGYREGASALMRCRESLIATGSAWRRTLEESHAPRVVVRETFPYGVLLSRSLRPEHLRSSQARRLAEQEALRDAAGPEIPAAVLRAELRSLLELHIPRFTALPGSRTLASSSGRALAPQYLACSPAESVLRKLQELSLERIDAIHVPALVLSILGRIGGAADRN